MINELKDEINPFLFNLEYTVDNKIVGYLKYTYMYDRMEIEDIKIEDAYKRQSIASLLMETLIEKAILYNVINITLEVNVNNEVAIKLYKKYNFKQIAIRQNYYDNADGILMEKKIRGE